MKSTNVRPAVRVLTGLVRGVFRVLDRVAPALGARLAERIWFTVPPARGGRHRTLPAGHSVELTAGGARVAGRTWGSGPPVYLVHGWGGHLDQFAALVEPLVGAGLRVVGLDAPSHGRSGPGRHGRRRTDLLEFADALHAAVAEYGPAAGVVAHSGGCIATGYALDHGCPVARLVFVAPMARLGAYTSVFADRLGFGERILTRLVPRIERRARISLDELDLPALAGRRSVPPVLVVHDERDPETFWADGREVADSWPGARLLSTTGLGHYRVLRDPEVVTAITDFLRPDGNDAPGARRG